MSVQLTYGITPAVAIPGMLAEPFSQRQVDSFIAEDTILAGQAVERGTDPASQVLQLTAAVAVYGVAISALQDNEVPEGGSITYAAKDSTPIITRGRIWVLSGGAVTVGAEVTPGVVANSGKWTAGANLLSPVRAFARSAAGGVDELLLIELAGPQGAVA